MLNRLLTVCLLALIGLNLLPYAANLGATPLTVQADSRYFPETQHWVSGLFLKYWNDHGGLAQQGYPLTEEFPEVNKLNGKTYTVQYFERAIFEWHPENAGTPYEVLLSQLGTYELANRYPNGSNPAAQPVPGPGASSIPFYEDRGGPLQLIQSYYNAINRREFQRAYNYWDSPSSAPPNGAGQYGQFAQGFSDTQSVTPILGTPQSQGAAGHIYSMVPAVIVATHTDNSVHVFYGCYTTVHTSPGIDPNPAALLERIFRASVQVAPPNVSYSTLLAQGCSQ